MTDLQLFDPGVFLLNEEITHTTVQTSCAPVSLLRSFYKNLEAVRAELLKLPGVLVKGTYERFNKDLYTDARKSYASSMYGTRPALFDQLPKVVAPILGLREDQLHFVDRLFINCFQKHSGFPENVQYGAHVDPSFSQLEQVALVVFLNEIYEEGEGLNFYRELNIPPDADSPFSSLEETPLAHFIQAEPNLAVLFDSKYPHGQAVGGGQFYREMRYTQVIFSSITS